MHSTNIVVIVPLFNRRRTVLAALNSIQSQTLRPAQLIVVDDGSTDGGGEAVLRWMQHAGSSLNCRLIQQPNRGVAAARNHALSQADPSEFVAFLDSDDIWPVDFLQRTQAALLSCPAAVAATCDKLLVSSTRPPVRSDCSGLSVDPILWLLDKGAGISSATLFPRSAIVRHGGYPPLFTGEDIALYLPLCLDGPWLHVPGEPIQYTAGFAQRIGDEDSLSGKFIDNYRRWARIVEDFFARHDDRILPSLKYKPQLARVWYKSGRELLQKSYPQEALACFRRSLEWNPRRLKYRSWMFYAWIKAHLRAAIPAYSGSPATVPAD